MRTTEQHEGIQFVDRASDEAVLPISVLIAVRNEELNIRRCLESVRRAERVVVLDSGSTDRTCEITEGYGREVVQFGYPGGYPKKRQWGLDQLDFHTEWILLLDADEVVPEALWAEIASVVSGPKSKDAYLITKGFHFLGSRFRFGGFSHAAVLLFRRNKARFEELVEDGKEGFDMEVHERLIVDGSLGELSTPLIHEDFKGLEAYLARHNGYSTWDARLRYSYKSKGRWGTKAIQPRLFGNTQERRRFIKQFVHRLPLEPQFWFIYHYVFRLGFLEGMPGLIASRIRSHYISDIRAKLYELTKSKAEGTAPARKRV